MSSLMRKKLIWAEVLKMAKSRTPFYIHAVMGPDAGSFDPATGTLTPQGTTNPGTLDNGKIYVLLVSNSADLNYVTTAYPASMYVIFPKGSDTFNEFTFWNGDYIQSTGSIAPSSSDAYVYFDNQKEVEIN